MRVIMLKMLDWHHLPIFPKFPVRLKNYKFCRVYKACECFKQYSFNLIQHCKCWRACRLTDRSFKCKNKFDWSLNNVGLCCELWLSFDMERENAFCQEGISLESLCKRYHDENKQFHSWAWGTSEILPRVRSAH